MMSGSIDAEITDLMSHAGELDRMVTIPILILVLSIFLIPMVVAADSPVNSTDWDDEFVAIANWNPSQSQERLAYQSILEVWLANPIDRKYTELNGEVGFLGAPISQEELAANEGKCRHYEGGSIYWHPSVGAYEIHGEILKKWMELGAEEFLGYPLTDGLETPDGIGKYQKFQEGVIIWTAYTGAHEIYGEILEKYIALGGYNSFLGYPSKDIYWTSNEKPLSSYPYSGLVIDWLGQDFYNPKSSISGSIWWTEENGAHEVHGTIWEKWKKVGYDSHTGDPILGHPTTDEHNTADGKGHYNHFTGGSIYWTQSTGAHYVREDIKDKWEELDSEEGILGYPISDEQHVPDGKVQVFEHGSIYWCPNSGAHAIHGLIEEEWMQQGGAEGFLGFPTTDILKTPNGKGKYANFKGGGIVWYPEAETEPIAHPWVEEHPPSTGGMVSVYLGESIYVDPKFSNQIHWTGGRSYSVDEDDDHLKDFVEGRLAQQLCPYFKFDSDEKARQPFEPVTLFQVRPDEIDGNGFQKLNTEILIRWAFLFRKDGGYGPGSWWEHYDDHPGDNDRALYRLSTTDGGFTWYLDSITLSDWHEDPFRRPYSTKSGDAICPELFYHHPVVYMSAHKHHMYFDTSYNHHNSHYSSVGIDDDVDGRGKALFADVSSIFEDARYNNVGEPEAMDTENPSTYFVNDLGKYYDGESAWGKDNFYECGSNYKLWLGLKQSSLPDYYRPDLWIPPIGTVGSDTSHEGYDFRLS